MFQPQSTVFEVKAPISAPINNGGWGIPPVSREPERPEWHADIEKKRAFGIRLGKGDKPLDAALFVFEGRMPDAMWAVQNWSRDPIVVETRESVENEINLLDKDQLLAKLLRFADEKSPQGLPLHEGKDRLGALKLYAEIQGYLSKVNIDASTITNVDNRMEIILVKPPEKEKVIEHLPSEEITKTYDLGVDLKLVG